MTQTLEKTIFLVGIGAAESLYSKLVSNLQEDLNQHIEVIVWWDDINCKQQYIDKLCKNSKVSIIAHSAGGMIALQAFYRNPNSIDKIAMLDSHIMTDFKNLPQPPLFLEKITKSKYKDVSTDIEQAYKQVLVNSNTFYHSFKHVVKWNSIHMQKILEKLNILPKHTVLYIGMSDCKAPSSDPT